MVCPRALYRRRVTYASFGGGTGVGFLASGDSIPISISCHIVFSEETDSAGGRQNFRTRLSSSTDLVAERN